MARSERIARAARPSDNHHLNRALARITEAPQRLGNRVSLLRNGSETYDDWLPAIARAQRWVHLENYIFKADQIGRVFGEALIERARAGVAMRVLVDWYGLCETSQRFWR